MKSEIIIIILILITEGSPSYPTSVTVSILSEESEKYKDTVGIYNIVPGEIYNDRPVWKHDQLKKFLFYSGNI